eukprot:TRINITY_DN4600_c0_g2_i1.p1 TRINITY_DN4600_c0_g2~~TRINITY_DN4600_c0_g2_i1.p1  ORF type:complete len:931 (+),score=155.44 TRINITY_DN4600_c0_g2_i1:37-2793(+)
MKRGKVRVTRSIKTVKDVLSTSLVTPKDALTFLSLTIKQGGYLDSKTTKTVNNKIAAIPSAAWRVEDILKVTHQFSVLRCLLPQAMHSTFQKKSSHFDYKQLEQLAHVFPSCLYPNIMILQVLLNEFMIRNKSNWTTFMKLLNNTSPNQSDGISQECKQFLLEAFIEFLRDIKVGRDSLQLVDQNTIMNVLKHRFVRTGALQNQPLLPSVWCRGLVLVLSVDTRRESRQSDLSNLFLKIDPKDVTIDVMVAAFRLLDSSNHSSFILSTLLATIAANNIHSKKLHLLLPFFSDRGMFEQKIANAIVRKSYQSWYGSKLQQADVALSLGIAGCRDVKCILANGEIMVQNRNWNHKDYIQYLRACNKLRMSLPDFAVSKLMGLLEPPNSETHDIEFVISISHLLAVRKDVVLVRKFFDSLLYPNRYREVPIKYFHQMVSVASVCENDKRSEVIGWMETQINRMSTSHSDELFASFDDLLKGMRRFGRVNGLLKLLTRRQVAVSSPEFCHLILYSMVTGKVVNDNLLDMVAVRLQDIVSSNVIKIPILSECLTYFTGLTFRCRELCKQSLPVLVSKRDIDAEQGCNILWSYSKQRVNDMSCKDDLGLLSNYLVSKLPKMSPSQISKAAIATESLGLRESSFVPDSEEYLCRNRELVKGAHSTVLTQVLSCYANYRLKSAAPILCEALERLGVDGIRPTSVGSYFMSTRLLDVKVTDFHIKMLQKVLPSLSSLHDDKLRSSQFNRMLPGDLCAILSVITEQEVDPSVVDTFFAAASEHLCQRHVVRSLDPKIAVLLLEAGSRWLIKSSTLFNTIGRSLADSAAVSQMLNRELVSLLNSYGKVSLRSPRLHAQICMRLSVSRDLHATELEKAVWGASALRLVNTPQSNEFWSSMRSHYQKVTTMTDEQKESVRLSFERVQLTAS